MDFSWLQDAYNWLQQVWSADAEYLLRTYGYYIILFLTFLEGETIVIIAGMLAAKGLMNPYYIALTAFLGSWISDQLMFSLGKYKGHAILHRFPKLEARMDKASGLFRKYDTALILGFRFVYGVRNVTPIMLGLSGVSHRKFLALNFIGAGVWAAAFTAGGFFFGKLFGHVMHNLGAVMLVLVGVIILVGGVVWFVRSRNKCTDSENTPND